MEAKTRLDAVRATLEQRGVHDVKFFFSKGVSDNSCAEVSAKVADFLEGFLSGAFRKVDSFGDRPQIS